jgi:GT2 family glycosyltransferase
MNLWSRVTVQIVTHHSVQWAVPLGRVLLEADAVRIVDNASSDRTAEAFESALPRAKVVRLPENIGFGAAHNAAALADPLARELLLLNPDCSITIESLGELLRVLDENPKVGAVSPQLVNPDGSLQVSARNAFFRPARETVTAGGPAEWLSGACLLVRRTAWAEVRGFDPRYFLFYEDDDLCLRLNRAGWQTWFAPSARAVHAAGTGSAFSWRRWWRKNFHQARSKRLALATWVSPAVARSYRMKVLLGSLFAVPMYLLLLQPRRAVKWAAWGFSAFAA